MVPKVKPLLAAALTAYVAGVWLSVRASLALDFVTAIIKPLTKLV